MGYDFHITRRRPWHDDQGPVISAEEWLRRVEEDAELELDPRNGPDFTKLRAGDQASPASRPRSASHSRLSFER